MNIHRPLALLVAEDAEVLFVVGRLLWVEWRLKLKAESSKQEQNSGVRRQKKNRL